MNSNNLLIGAIDVANPSINGWEYMKVWALSARECGHDGDIALLCYRTTPDIIENCKKLAIDCYQVTYNEFGQELQYQARGRDTIVHQTRLFHAWQLLQTNEHWKKYDKVIMTDIKDVYFQKNPFKYHLLEENTLLASSEGMKYKDEIWGMENMRSGYGELIAHAAEKWTIYNVGVLAGSAESMMGLFLTLYSMSSGRYIPNDQSSFNIVVNTSSAYHFGKMNHHVPWAAQLGTTLDPTKAHYIPQLIEPRPIIKDGKVYTAQDELFHIVHQYDRVPDLRKIIEERYA